MRSIMGVAALAAASLGMAGPAIAETERPRQDPEARPGKRERSPVARSNRPLTARANLSAYHPDFGMTPAEHAAKKAKRPPGWVPEVTKDQLRARRSGLLGGMFRGR